MSFTLNLKDLIEKRDQFLAAKIKLPDFDVKSLQENTLKHPVWMHMGTGNIFTGFIGSVAQKLIDSGELDSGIIGLEVHSRDNLDKIVLPHDHLRLNVTLLPDGSSELEVLASVCANLLVNGQAPHDEEQARKAFANPSLQLLSFTITEKGYALKDINGNFLPQIVQDFESGPYKCRSGMAITAALLLERFNAGCYPITLLSMDNCSHNGSKLKDAVLEIASQWVQRSLAPAAFIDYLKDESKVAFPWSMIDKITPRPDPEIAKHLSLLGLLGMDPIKTSRGTFIAPFVNAEKPQYLVVEDKFPGGRPPLEHAGVIFTSGEKVDLCERMKVTTCLNPLHTALAVYGCLLGYDRIWKETEDPELMKLVNILGYQEGLPVVEDPKVLNPEDFLKEVITVRLPNRCLPDSPQRIATDTSLKIPVRFGQTLKNYQKRGLDSSKLTALPLAIAGWLRYLMGIDDHGLAFELSDDPQLPQLRKYLKDIKYGYPESVQDRLHPILENEALFGVDLYKAGLGSKIEEMFKEQISGPGSIRTTLIKYLGKDRT